jgi:hypothetical protein
VEVCYGDLDDPARGEDWQAGFHARKGAECSQSTEFSCSDRETCSEYSSVLMLGMSDNALHSILLRHDQRVEQSFLLFY